ncbi:MAG: hypothetical protein NVS9B15_13680 [Acidobacteriaceae bacterium]
MRVLLYCVSTGARVPSGLSGVGGAPLEHRHIGDLTLSYSAVQEELLADPQARLQFYRALMDLLAYADVVPFRFPTRLQLEHADAEITRNAAAYHSTLAHIAGHVQMEVELPIAHPPQSARPAHGRDYLLGKLNLQQSTQSLAKAIKLSAADHASDWSLVERSGRRLLCALVRRNAVADFVAATARAQPGLRITGPWPASAFIDQGKAESA